MEFSCSSALDCILGPNNATGLSSFLVVSTQIVQSPSNVKSEKIPIL